MKDLKQFIKTTIREFLNENNSHLVEVTPNKYVYRTTDDEDDVFMYKLL
jgi:hypothetical protein